MPRSYTLVINCPDRPGIVHHVSGLILNMAAILWNRASLKTGKQGASSSAPSSKAIANDR